MKILRTIFIITLLACLIVPSSARAQATFQYGLCDDGNYVYYEDWLVDTTSAAGGWGSWIDGYGWEHIRWGGGYTAPMQSITQVGGDPIPIDGYPRTAFTIYTEGEYLDFLFQEGWALYSAIVTSGQYRLDVIDEHGHATYQDPQVRSHVDTRDGHYYVTALLVEGTYTGDCPVDELPTLPLGLTNVRPLRDDVLYEVNHVDSETPLVDDVHTELGANVYNSFAGQVISIADQGDGYMVKVRATDNTWAIYSNLRSVYPRLNDTITTGCVIGTVAESFKTPTGGPYTQDPGLLWYYPGTDWFDFEQDEYIDWQNEFYEPPQNGVPCGSELRSDHCLNYNPSLEDRAAGWLTLNVPDYYIYDNQVQLPEYQSSISQYVVLDDAADNYITVSSRIYQNYDALTVSVMGATELDLLDTELITLDLQELGYEPGDLVVSQVGPIDLTDYDVNDTYLITIMVMSQNSGGVFVDDICVSTGDAVVGIDYCYFPDWHLKDSTQWTTHAGADWDSNPSTFGTGVVLGPGEWISGPVSLPSYDDEDVDYTLTLGGKVTGIDIGDLTEIFGGWSVAVAQEVYDGETVELDIGDTTVDNALIVLSTPTDFTVPMTTTVVGDLTITSDPANTKNLYLDYLCIQPKTGVWPGTEDPDVPGTKQTCDDCSMPTGLSIAELAAWLSWLWCNLSKFFFCTLIQWLLSLWNLLHNVADFAGLIGRYIGVLLSHIALWSSNLLGEIISELLNALRYVASLIWNALIDLSFFRLLYDLLGYLIALLTNISLAGSLAIDALLDAVGIILAIAAMMQAFATSLVTALSGTSTTITLPSCETPTALTEGFCLVFTFADGVFDEFVAFGYALVIDAAIIAFITIVWSIREFGKVFAAV